MKFTTLLAIMLLLCASIAGCTSEKIEENTSSNENKEQKEELMGDPLIDVNPDDQNITINPIDSIFTNDSNMNLEPTTKEYTPQEVLALMGVDGTPDATLNLDAPKIGHDKFGMELILNIPANTIPNDLTKEMEQNIEITYINMYENIEEKITHDIRASLPMGSWSIEIRNLETQVAHPDILNAGLINRIATNEVSFQPEAEWIIDYNWDYNNIQWGPNIEEIAEIFSPLQECNGQGYIMQSMEDLGPHCMCNEGYDWDDSNMLTCVSESEEVQTQETNTNEDDEGGIPLIIPEPTAEELSATEWASITNEITGIQSFSGIVTMEEMGNWSITLSILPTIPAKVTGLIMSNETESYDMSFMYGDDIEIDFVFEDTDGWDRATSDLSFNIERIDEIEILEIENDALIQGCTDPEANNFDQNAEEEDGTCTYDSSSKPKILALHGGGDSAQGLQSQGGMQDLMDELTEFEFIFVDTPEDDGVWVRDPPGGKGEGTNDPNWADTSINFLDNYIEENGPFYGLLGYSQGAAMIPIYLAYSDNSFEKVMHFNGYLETGHQGLMDTINQNSPFAENALIFEGEDDTWFGYGSAELVEHYTNSIHLVGDAGHHLPYSNDRAFNEVVSFFRENPEPVYGCTDSSAINYDNVAEEDDGSCEYEEEESFKITTILYANISGNIEVPKTQLKLHIITNEGTTQFHFNQEGSIGEWTDSQFDTWDITWICDEEDKDSQDQILMHSNCKITMIKTWVSNSNDSSIIENKSLEFEIKLFDSWANDYTDVEYMPSFTFGISLMALLGACLLLQRKKFD